MTPQEERAAVEQFRLDEKTIRQNLDRFRPPQDWYDEDVDLFGEDEHP